MILLHLLSTFDYSAAGRQVSLIAPVLRSLPAGLDIHVAALGGTRGADATPLAAPVRAAGLPVHILGSGRRFDPAAIWALRRLIRDLRPEIIHAWRPPAVRAVGLLRTWGRSDFRLVVSEARRGGRMKLLDRWLLRSADAVIAGHPAEAVAIHRLGIAPEHIHELPAAVALPADDPPLLELPLPADAKIVMCVGPLRPKHGFRDAVWAADVLRYPIPNLHLVIIGDGPERPRLVRFARSINPAGGHAHLLPARPDAAALLARADVVWAPSRSESGGQVVLEAMAAGRPVVATALPGLAALIADGQTGLLIPPGDPLELARRSRPLLDDGEWADRVGAAGRAAVAAFTPERAAAAYAALYAAL